MTGFLIWTRGSSFLNASGSDFHSILRVEETAADPTPRSNEILGGQRGIAVRCLW